MIINILIGSLLNKSNRTKRAESSSRNISRSMSRSMTKKYKNIIRNKSSKEKKYIDYRERENI